MGQDKNGTPLKPVTTGLKRKAIERGFGSPENEEEVTDNNSKLSLEEVFGKLLDKIEETAKSHSEEVTMLRNDLAEWRQDIIIQIESIKSKMNQVESNMDNFNAKMDKVERKVEELEKKSSLNAKDINRMMQEKLECHMEIVGLSTEVIEKTDDVKELALKTITAQGIGMEMNDLDKVFKRIINRRDKNQKEYKKGILTVVFKDFTKKIQVMKDKRESKKRGSIFFNIALTPSNRYYLHKAKEITEGKMKIYFGKGNVRAVMNDKTELIVDDDRKIEELIKCMENMKSQTSK